ncbi:MAG: c-type cytochrome domain-containing protein, partial [Pseudomonadota bacterium]|nr:c-type cytochrome domain-containing protein [Pseudomonadota bacterium]
MRMPFRPKSLVLLLSCLPHMAQAQAPAEHVRMLETYCFECHNAEDWSGSLDLSAYDLGNAVADAEVWENVLRKFRGNMMPPQGNPRPSEAEYAALSEWL